MGVCCLFFFAFNNSSNCLIYSAVEELVLTNFSSRGISDKFDYQVCV